MMYGDLQFFDIIIFAGIAAFLIYRLRNVRGKRTGFQRQNNKTIIINRSSEKIYEIIQELIERNIKNVRIIINSGILEKKSKLRSLFEKKQNLYCIPAYHDTNETLSRIAITFLKALMDVPDIFL